MPLREVDPAEFRQLCGHFATGVVVLTAQDIEGRPAGMTANSFASVSLSPPLMSVNVDHSADMHAVMKTANRFAINILRSDQEAISRRFAGNLSRRFQGIGYRPDESGFILLDGVLATILCESHASLEAGDHTIFIGRIVGGGVAPGRPLLYYRGGYVTAGLP
jgi:flavin reductase (DIM6/NTAB) family NADH-FMN oxidoreductase RutF